MTRLVCGLPMLFALMSVGCGSRKPVPCEGTLGCECYPNGTCADGLACSGSNVCFAPHPPAGDSTGHSQPSAAGHAGSHAPSAAGATSAAGRQAISGGAGATRAVAGGAASQVAGASASACVGPGGNCAAGPCCDKALCVADLCAAPCATNRDCVTHCCSSDGAKLGSCAPPNVCGVTASALDASITQCAAAGGDCATDWCCSGPCIENVCADPCNAAQDCASGCCRTIGSGNAECVPSTLCAGAPADAGFPTSSIGRCSQLTLQADDGTFLGMASSSTVASDGVCNSVSSYGSMVTSYSIFNIVGAYGSSTTAQSAYNEVTPTPPRLYCNATGQALNHVTKNAVFSDAVDPDMLCAVLAKNDY